MGGAECLERPYLHLSETLATELGLTAQRLLRDQRVRTDGTCVHLVLDHVAQLQHVDHAHSGRLVETVARAAVVQVCLAVAGQPCLVGPFVQVVQTGSVEDRSSKFLAKFAAGPSEHGLEYLTQVHTRRHTQRVQHDVHGSSVGQERHVFLTHHAADDTLVTVTSCHLVTYADLTLLGNVHLGHLHDAGGKLVTDGDVELAAVQLGVYLLRLAQVVGDKFAYHTVDALVLGPVAQMDCLVIQRVEVDVVECGALGHDVHADVVLDTH